MHVFTFFFVISPGCGGHLFCGLAMKKNELYERRHVQTIIEKKKNIYKKKKKIMFLSKILKRSFSSYSRVTDPVMGIRLVSEKKCAVGSTFDTFNRVDTKELTQHSMTDHFKGVKYVAKTENDHMPFYLEHHPRPNLRVNYDSESVVAIRPIQPGDFLSIDYSRTEHVLFSQFPTVSNPVITRPWTTGSQEDLSDDGKKWLNVDTEQQDLLTSCHVEYENDRLHYHGIDLKKEAESFDPDTPLYLYSKQALQINLHRVHHYMFKHFERSTVLYSVKSNSSPSILSELRHLGQNGLDVCSPQEVDRARECGFDVSEMHYTGTNLTDRDLERLGRHPELKINCDSLSLMERIPHTKHVGLRLDPNMGMSYQDDARLQCTCEGTKMGILLPDIGEACEIAKKRGINLERIHAHVGNSFQSDDISSFNLILDQISDAISICESNGFDIQEVNLGGGYGVPYLPEEKTFDWDKWAECVKQYPEITKKRIFIEPGDSIVKNAGVLISRVSDTYEKAGTTFVGLGVGMNLNPLPAFYDIHSYPLPLLKRWDTVGTPNTPLVVDVAGNLNESIDVWQRNVPMTPVQSGDFIALLNSGGYAHSCRTNHSLRNEFNSLLI
jgi:diaminopimelate decarboxylase